MLGSALREEISRCRVSPPPPLPCPPFALPRRLPVSPGAPPRSTIGAAFFDRDRFRGRFGRVRLDLFLAFLFVRLLVLVRLQQVGGVEEGALLLPDVHERGLNAGQHRFDPAEVDVADRAPVVGAIHQQLDQPVVLQDRHPGFPLAPVDQDLALQAFLPRQGRRRNTNAPPGASLSVEKDTWDGGVLGIGSHG